MQSYQQPQQHQQQHQQQQQQQLFAYYLEQLQEHQPPAYDQGGLVHSPQDQGEKTGLQIWPRAHNTRASTIRAHYLRSSSTLPWIPPIYSQSATQNLAFLSPGLPSADFSQAQALPVTFPPPAIQQQAAPRGGIQKRPEVAAGRAKRGRPRADDRLHGEQPSGDAAAMVQVAWNKAEASYHRLRSARKRREQYERRPEAKKTSPGEVTRMEKCVTKNTLLYEEAVVNLRVARTGPASKLLPATNVAEQELARREEVLAEREGRYREARGQQAPPDPLKHGELAWHASAKNQVEEQRQVVEACRERDRNYLCT